MNLAIDKRGGSPVAVLDDAEFKLCGVAEALDLMADARHLYEADAVLVPKENVCEEFFDLKTGIAGEILQKYTNYSMKIAIVGDFSGYGSKALRDFIRESNKGGKALFLQDREEALERLGGK